jgi:hypothetical protein
MRMPLHMMMRLRMTRIIKMSDIGLYGSVYEYLRTYAERLDRSLIDLRNSDNSVAKHARTEIVQLLREITNTRSINPATRLVSVILRQDLPSVTGKGLSLCESLAQILELRMPDANELNQLEQIAITLDRECSTTLARMRGKR